MLITVMRLRLGMLALLCLPALLAAGPARAQPPGACPGLFVPADYRLVCEASQQLPGGWRLQVKPEHELLAPLNQLTVRPLEEPVEAPDLWLQEQLTLDLTRVGVALREVLGAPGSPLYEPALEDPLDSLVQGLAALDQLPLRGCGFPAMLEAHDAWQIACDWRLGPLHQHALVRLVERGERAYAINILASSERRLRHLVAIANGF